MTQTFKELEVWRAAMDLAVSVADLTQRFPREFRWLADQMMRSSESVPSNIAEGFERRTNGDFIRFLRIAKASVAETESHLVYAHRRGLVNTDEDHLFECRCISVKKMLNSLISYLIRKSSKSNEKALDQSS